MSRPPAPRPVPDGRGRAPAAPARGQRPGPEDRGGRARPARERAPRVGRAERAPIRHVDDPRLTALSAAMGGAPTWASGAIAGAQAALLSVLAVVTPALAAYVATSADPANADVPWTRSVAVGAAMWLMGHGGSLAVDGLSLTIVPLGITALAVFVAHASARRSAYPSRGAWLAGIGAYVASVLVVLALTGSAGPIGAGAGSVLRTLAGAVLVAAVGLGWGMLRPGRLAEISRPVTERVPAPVRAVLRAGAMVPGLLLAAAAVVTVGWAFSGRAGAGDVIAGLGLDTFSGLMMAIAQLSVVPNLVVWAVAWLAGPGFAVGQGTVFSPSQVVSGPMPALPMLGSLPAEPSPWGVWVPSVVVAAGVVAGWWLHRRVPPRAAWQPVALAVGAGVVAGLVVSAATALAGGSVGPGRMSEVGARPLEVGTWVAVLAAAGALLVAVPADAAVHDLLRRGWARLRRSDARPADADAAGGAGGPGGGRAASNVPLPSEDGLA